MPYHRRDMGSDRAIETASEPSDFRLFLQAELARRCSRNEQYSLRAFAQSLGFDHSSLSQMLRGKRRITLDTIRELCPRLSVDAARTERFLTQANATTREVPTVTYNAIVQLAQDAAGLMSEWSGYAILELVRLRDFRADTRWIANVLGISPDEVNIALQRLLRLGLLEMSDADRWRDRSRDGISAESSQPLATISRLLERVQRLSSSVATVTDSPKLTKNP